MHWKCYTFNYLYNEIKNQVMNGSYVSNLCYLVEVNLLNIHLVNSLRGVFFNSHFYLLLIIFILFEVYLNLLLKIST